MSDFKAKMHQIPFRLGLRPRPRWELTALPRPLAGFGGPISKARGGEGRAGFESDGNAQERRSRSFLYVPVVDVFFCILQLLTVIFHGSPSVIKLICLLSAFMHVNNSVCRVGYSLVLSDHR